MCPTRCSKRSPASSRCRPASVRAEDRLADLVPSSFSLIELLIELQEEHGIRLSQEDLRGLVTVGDLVALVESKR